MLYREESPGEFHIREEHAYIQLNDSCLVNNITKYLIFAFECVVTIILRYTACNIGFKAIYFIHMLILLYVCVCMHTSSSSKQNFNIQLCAFICLETVSKSMHVCHRAVCCFSCSKSTQLIMCRHARVYMY